MPRGVVTQTVSRLRSLVREPQRIRHWLNLQRDYAEFKARHGFLAEAGRLQEPDKRALIVSLTEWVAEVKCEIMLATALRLRGWSPVVLTRSDYTWAQRYFKASGIDQFVFFDQALAELDGGTGLWPQLAEALVTPCGTVRDLLDLKFRNVYVGRHVISTIVRALRCGHADLRDPQVAAGLRELLPQSLQAVHAAERVVETVDPQLVLFLEKGYSPYGELFDVAVNRGINTVQWSHGHRSDAFVLKRYTDTNRHVHPFSLSPETWNRVRQVPWSEEAERELSEELVGRYEQGSWFSRKFLHVGKRMKPAEEVRRQLGLRLDKKTAVVFSHVLWDATFFFGENLFDDYETWLIETVKAACANEALNWVIKLHPDYVWKLKAMGGGEVRDRLALAAQIGSLPPHVRLLEPETDLSTFSLFGVTDYGLTVRGTIGVELPCFGIPVFTAGTGRYSGFGFTIDSASRAEYLERLGRIQTFPRLTAAQTELAKTHAYALLRLRPCPFTTFEMVQSRLEELGHPLDHNVVIRAESHGELTAAEDLRRFAKWAGDPSREDYLLREPAVEPIKPEPAVVPAGSGAR